MQFRNLCNFFIIAFGLVIVGACAETASLRGHLKTSQARVTQIEQNGAYTCAPKELALAQAHLEFAQLEIKQGLGSRAQRHYEVAKKNLDLADEKTIPEECAQVSVVVAEPLPTPVAPPPPPKECVDDDNDFICEETDKCPQKAEDYDGIQDKDGCPEDQDTDQDGLLDSVDQCVLDPEDIDNYQDDDGCPEKDNDLDGIIDTMDKCPMELEDFDGYEDLDGCPDDDNDGDGIVDIDDECPNTTGLATEKGCPKKYEGVVITETRIEINQKIFFAYNKAKIKAKSHKILNTVAQVLNENAEITLSIEGHTDSRGRDKYNKRLSEKRAKAVMDYLIKKGGVDAGRLTSVGWGEEKPIDSNLTEDGRAANRRVEFVRTDK